MVNTLGKNSGIWLLKSKFFISRALIYFSFLLIPVWIQKTLNLHQGFQAIMMIFYMLFMGGQWFLLGKEIDHRFKIYFRVNSSIDRVVYRLMTGIIFFTLYFNLLNFLPMKWIYNLFWTTWVILGLFYSWPTRGKIIKESVTTHFSEFRYLDGFEKTLLMLNVLLFLFSLPEFPTLVNYEALKLFFDPLEKFNPQIWNFLTINYFPFKRYPELFKLALCLHFYFINMGLFLFTFYAFLRYFVSRRLSLLGVFALLSSWSFSKILAAGFGDSLVTTYSLLWIWTLLWVTKSSTYRAGLFIGLVGYWGTIINQTFGVLVFIQIALFYFVFSKDKTNWYKRQTIKYALFGTFLTFLVFVHNFDFFENLKHLNWSYFSEVFNIAGRKAFYALSLFGVSIFFFKLVFPDNKFVKDFRVDEDKMRQFVYSFGALILVAIFFDSHLVTSFSLLWPIALLSLIPIEAVFQSISRLRSSRNMIYLIYILICLLDSHFEGRVKIFLRFFD